METNHFAENLTAYRRDHFLTQRQMAELLGVSVNHIGVLEHGFKKPRASTLAAFARLTDRKNWPEFDEAVPMNQNEKMACGRIWEELSEMKPGRRKEMMNRMNEDERAVYEQIWREIRSLDPEKEKEVIEMFMHILDCL